VTGAPDDDDSWRENYRTTVALAVRLDAMRRFLRSEGAFGLDVLAREDVEGRRVLEVGCGSGVHVRRFVERTGARPASWTFLDRSEAMAHEAVGRARGAVRGVRAVVGEIERLPVAADARFDLIVAMHVIQHVDGRLRAVRALASRLAPGGRLLVTTVGGRDMASVRRRVRASLRAQGCRAAETAVLTYPAAEARRHLRAVLGAVRETAQTGALEFPTADDAVRYADSMAWLDGWPAPVRDRVLGDLRDAAGRTISREGAFRVEKESVTFVAG